MNSADALVGKRLDFKYLPGFASYLLEHRLEELIREQLRISREIKLPMLKYFEHMSDDHIVEMSKVSHREFLTALINNKADEQIEESLRLFVNDKMQGLGQEQVAVEDITLSSYMRKESYLKFITEYTTKPSEIVELIKEVDHYNIAIDTAASTTFIEILRNKLNLREAQLLEAQDLVLMGSFTWNLQTKHSEVTPQLLKILELDHPDDFESYMERIHPDDRANVQLAIDRAISDDGIYDCEYRYHTASGEKRIWSHGLVGRENGIPVVMKGTVMDITERHRLVEALKEKESLYKQAETLTHIGSWIWEIESNDIVWSDELYRIYGIEPQKEKITFERFISFVHPEDRERVTNEVQKSLNTQKPNDFYHRIVLESGIEKVLHAKGNVQVDAGGKPCRMVGTGQDVTERQRMLEQMQRSDDLYKQAQTLAHIGNWSWDLVSNEVKWSDELFRIHGLTPASVTPTFELELSLIHPEDRQRVTEAIRTSLKLNRAGEVYYRLLLHDGTEKVIHGKSETFANANGWVYMMTGTAQDVTEQQLIEKQLRDNQNFIQKVADATPSIIATYNVNTGKYSYISGGLEKLLGYDPKTALDEGVQFFINIVHPDDLGPLMERNSVALSETNSKSENDNDVLVEFKYRMRHKNGQYRWFNTYGTIFDRNENGLVEHVLNISLDVTDRVQAERRVVERESFIQHIADASPSVLYLFDIPSSRVTYVNSEIEAVLGFTPDEIIRMGNLFTPTVYHPEDINKSPEEYGGYKMNLNVQPIMEYECRMKHKHDTWRWMLVREMIYERDADGKPVSVLGSALDITDRKKMEETLIRRTGELQQTNANLAEFAYVASHDLKEPLRKIQVFADRIAAKEAERLSESGKDWFGRMKSAATRMDALIDDLLSFSRTNTTDEIQEPVDLEALLKIVKADLSEPIEKSEVAVESDPLPVINGIAIQLRQLFQNLLSNGIKFRKPGVKPIIRIAVDTVQGNEIIDFKAEKNKRYLKLMFIDNGIGFEPEYAEKIFGLFQRLHGKAEYPGTGIGLALCRKVVENHNGFIAAESELGNGATFIVHLPI